MNSHPFHYACIYIYIYMYVYTIWSKRQATCVDMSVYICIRVCILTHIFTYAPTHFACICTSYSCRSVFHQCLCVCVYACATIALTHRKHVQKHTALTHTLPCHCVRLCNLGFQNRRVGWLWGWGNLSHRTHRISSSESRSWRLLPWRYPWTATLYPQTYTLTQVYPIQCVYLCLQRVAHVCLCVCVFAMNCSNTCKIYLQTSKHKNKNWYIYICILM